MAFRAYAECNMCGQRTEFFPHRGGMTNFSLVAGSFAHCKQCSKKTTMFTIMILVEEIDAEQSIMQNMQQGKEEDKE